MGNAESSPHQAPLGVHRQDLPCCKNCRVCQEQVLGASATEAETIKSDKASATAAETVKSDNTTLLLVLGLLLLAAAVAGGFYLYRSQ